MRIDRLLRRWSYVRKTSMVCGASYLPAITRAFWKEGCRAISKCVQEGMRGEERRAMECECAPKLVKI